MDHSSDRPSSEAGDRFLALLGHEMRNPLGALRNALDLIERHPEGDLRRRQLKIARRVRRERDVEMRRDDNSRRNSGGAFSFASEADYSRGTKHRAGASMQVLSGARWLSEDDFDLDSDMLSR